MFSYQAIAWPHDGQRERGAARLIAGVGSWATPSRSALSCFQSRSSISGRRWMTTFRKLPMHSPNRARTSGERKTSAKGIGPYTTWPSLKIGRYIETTMPPIRVPRMTMMNGSIRLDRPLTASSTSSS